MRVSNILDGEVRKGFRGGMMFKSDRKDVRKWTTGKEHLRQREQPVQRPWGKSFPGICGYQWGWKGEWNRMKEWLKFIKSAVPWILHGNTGICQMAMTQLGNIPHLRSELGKWHRNDRFASHEHTVPGLLFYLLGDHESEESWTKKNAPGCEALPRAFACTGIHPLNIKIHLFYIKWWSPQCWTHLLFLKTNDGHQILSNGEGENESTNDKRLKEDSCVRAHLCRLFCCKILLKIFTIQLYVPRNLTLESQII